MREGAYNTTPERLLQASDNNEKASVLMYRCRKSIKSKTHTTSTLCASIMCFIVESAVG
jgi:hypothetical protein